MSADASNVKIPESWEQKSLGDVCKVVSGSTPKTSVNDYWGGDIPWLTPNDLSKNRKKVVNGGERYITQLGFDSCSTQMVPKGSVLFTSRAPIGYVAIAGVPMCTNQGFKSAVPTSKVLSEFLYWQLQNVTDDIRSRASGTTFLEISGGGFSATEIVIPPVDEQQKIVEILEEQLSHLDAALASVRAVREKAARFRRSLLHAAFTGALTARNTSLGALPDGWEKSTMGEIGRYLNGFAFSSKTWSRVGRPIIRIQNLTGSGSEYNYFDGEIDDRYVVREGDLLFSWAATLGVYIWPGPEALLNQHIFKVESNIDKSFHRSLIEHKTAEMMQQTHGTGMVHITKKKFDAIPILKPPVKEQEEIVEILEEQLSRLDASLSVADFIEKKASALRRSLLHAAFTGDLTKEWREGAYV